ncbi:MAG: hypothetical protein V3T06_01600 [Dehalococcoidia bacterium]
MGILEDGIKATERHVFALERFDTYPNIDIEGTCSNPQSTVTYVVSLHSGLKYDKALP